MIQYKYCLSYGKLKSPLQIINLSLFPTRRCVLQQKIKQTSKVWQTVVNGRGARLGVIHTILTEGGQELVPKPRNAPRPCVFHGVFCEKLGLGQLLDYISRNSLILKKQRQKSLNDSKILMKVQNIVCTFVAKTIQPKWKFLKECY